MDVEGAQPATAAAQHNARIVLDISGTSARDYSASAALVPARQPKSFLNSRVLPPLSGIVFLGDPDKGRPWVSSDIEEAR